MPKVGDNIELVDEDNAQIFFSGVIVALPTVDVPWYSCDFECEFLDGKKENLWLSEEEFTIEN